MAGTARSCDRRSARSRRTRSPGQWPIRSTRTWVWARCSSQIGSPCANCVKNPFRRCLCAALATGCAHPNSPSREWDIESLTARRELRSRTRGTRVDGWAPSRRKPKSWHIPEPGNVGQKGVAMTNTTEVIPAPSARPFRAKYLVFAAVAAMAAYVLYHNERFLIDPAHPVWNHYDPFKWWLLPHGIAGLCALVLAPLQFAEGLRRRHTALHRTTGTI